MSSPSSADGRRGVAILGSTGSIGRQTLDVIEHDPDAYRIVGLAAGSQIELLDEQVRRHRPRAVAVADEADRTRLETDAATSVDAGPDALTELATRDDVAIVVVATGGIVSLRPVIAALRAGKIVATANKETLVAAGHLVMPLAQALASEVAAGRAAGAAGGVAAPGRDLLAGPFASPLAWLRPIDSEHSAIWQCLVGEPPESVSRLILTASGGPFLDGPANLDAVTRDDALRHPTWRMGDKITIDSATLANKGLEVIEACWLYDVDDAAIDVVIHPQSVVHSAVVFRDGSLKAQLGTPDMRLPIQYALSYPERRPSPAAPVDLVAASRLDFRAPDNERFPALDIARAAGRTGSRASAALIAADDVAVGRFLAGSLGFTAIPRLLEAAVTRFGEGADQAPDLGTLIDLDREVRAAFATSTHGSPA